MMPMLSDEAVQTRWLLSHKENLAKKYYAENDLVFP
jgi:hypothetical protein